MGDRANIIIKSENDKICLYTHWYGTELPETLKNALIRGKERWGDFQYLTRIIFCEMVRGQEMDTTGFGISSIIGDGGENIIYVDTHNNTISHNDNESTFEEYIR